MNTKKKTKSELKWHSFEDVFGKMSKKKEFQKAYSEEMVRLRLAKQIRELRISHKMTQQVVAQKAGMPNQ